MASHVHYKFKSAKSFDSVAFSGTVINLFDLKRAIVEAKNLHKGMDFDLQITNEQTNEEYTDDSKNVTKNTSVIVKRVPARPKVGGMLAKMKAMAQATATMNSTDPVGGATSAAAVNMQQQQLVVASSIPTSTEPMTAHDEDTALAALHVQAATHRAHAQHIGNKSWTAAGGSNAARISNYNVGVPPAPQTGTAPSYKHGVLGHGRAGHLGAVAPNAPPPPMYVCKRCNISGHFVKDCPTNGDPTFDNARRKRTLGVPATMLKVVEEQKGGGLVDAQGRRVTIKSNKQAFTKLKDLKGGGGGASEQLLEHLSAAAPAHLKCPICTGIVQEAVLVPCCQASVCDACIRQELAVHRMKCPLCMRLGLSPDQLMPNRSLRAAVDDFITRMTKDTRARADLDREAAQILQQAEFDSAQAAAAVSMSSTGGRSSVSRRRGHIGVDAILDLGPRTKKLKEDEKEEDALDDNEFGADVYDVTPIVHEKTIVAEAGSKSEEKDMESPAEAFTIEEKTEFEIEEPEKEMEEKREEISPANFSPKTTPPLKPLKGPGGGWKGWELEKEGGPPPRHGEPDESHTGGGAPWAQNGEYHGPHSQPPPWMMMGPRPWIMGPPMMGGPWGMGNPAGGWGPMGGIDNYHYQNGGRFDRWGSRGGRGRGRGEWYPDGRQRYNGRYRRSRSRSPHGNIPQGYGSLAQGQRRQGREERESHSRHISRPHNDRSRSTSLSRKQGRTFSSDDRMEHVDREDSSAKKYIDRSRNTDAIVEEQESKAKPTVAIVDDDGSDSAREKPSRSESIKKKLKSDAKRSEHVHIRRAGKERDEGSSRHLSRASDSHIYRERSKDGREGREVQISKESDSHGKLTDIEIVPSLALDERSATPFDESDYKSVDYKKATDGIRIENYASTPYPPNQVEMLLSRGTPNEYSPDTEHLSSSTWPKMHSEGASAEILKGSLKSSRGKIRRTTEKDWQTLEDSATEHEKVQKSKGQHRKHKKDKKNRTRSSESSSKVRGTVDAMQREFEAVFVDEPRSVANSRLGQSSREESPPSRRLDWQGGQDDLLSQSKFVKDSKNVQQKSSQPAATVASAAAAAAAAAASSVQAQHSLKSAHTSDRPTKGRMVSLVGIKSSAVQASVGGLPEWAQAAVNQELGTGRKHREDTLLSPASADFSDFYTKKKRKEGGGGGGGEGRKRGMPRRRK